MLSSCSRRFYTLFELLRHSKFPPAFSSAHSRCSRGGIVVAGFRSRWQQVKHHWIALGVGAIVLVAVITLIIVGYWFDWTGFNGYNKVTLAYTTSGTNASTVTSIEEYQPGKALWDWPPLLGILAIPVVVGWFTFQQGRASDAKRKQQHETDLKIAADQQGFSQMLRRTYLDCKSWYEWYYL